MKIVLGLVLFAIAVVVVFMVAANQGKKEQDRMRSALTLTGNYVGMTEGQIYELGTAISREGTGTIGEAREILFWLVCSGKFSREAVEPSARAALRLVAAKGVSPKQAVADLAATTGAGSDPFMVCPK